MPNNPRDRVLGSVDREQTAVLRREKALMRDIVKAYNQARTDILAEFTEKFSGLGDNPRPADIRQLATDLNLIRAIERRLAELEAEFGRILRGSLTNVSTEAFAAASAQVGILADAIGLNLFQFALDPLLELTIAPAIEQIPGLVGGLQANIIAQLRQSLAAGSRFRDIAAQIFSNQPGSVFKNGMTSAQLMARRAVSQANNNARQIFMEQVQQTQIPDLKKQIVAKIDGRTTKLSLDVHGQIKPVDEPFVMTSGPPKPFARRMMHPPFTWNDRDTVAPYLPQFEQTSGLTTADMRAEARAEINKRES